MQAAARGVLPLRFERQTRPPDPAIRRGGELLADPGRERLGGERRYVCDRFPFPSGRGSAVLPVGKVVVRDHAARDQGCPICRRPLRPLGDEAGERRLGHLALLQVEAAYGESVRPRLERKHGFLHGGQPPRVAHDERAGRDAAKHHAGGRNRVRRRLPRLGRRGLRCPEPASLFDHRAVPVGSDQLRPRLLRKQGGQPQRQARTVGGDPAQVTHQPLQSGGGGRCAAGKAGVCRQQGRQTRLVLDQQHGALQQAVALFRGRLRGNRKIVGGTGDNGGNGRIAGQIDQRMAQQAFRIGERQR